MRDDMRWLPVITSRARFVWGSVWAGLVVVCVVVGIYTRLSFTDINADMDRLLDMPYRAMPAFSLDQDMVPEPDRTLDLHAGPADVIARSPVIVSCVFEGDRRYQYQSFLSDMRVVRVYQGDGIAVGQILPVFEPARIVKDSPTSQYAMPSGMYASGYVMMEEGGTYLLFLAAKVYAAEEDRTGKPTEYVMQEHPYANLA